TNPETTVVPKIKIYSAIKAAGWNDLRPFPFPGKTRRRIFPVPKCRRYSHSSRQKKRLLFPWRSDASDVLKDISIWRPKPKKKQAQTKSAPPEIRISTLRF